MNVHPIGTILHKRFKIQTVLGTGLLGNLYIVKDIKISERILVAREFIPLPAGSEERGQAENKFHEQVEIIKTLRHPNLIQVWDSFIEENRTYLITEYVEGFSLEAVLQITPEMMSENQVLEWGIQACNALEYLHNSTPPFYMKDLSPRALVVARDKKLKVGAFGLHLIFTPPEEIQHSFLAPEFRATGEGTKATDVYSLAATFYFLLTRQSPEQPIRPASVLNPKVSKGTSLLLHQCLQPDPAQRRVEIYEIRESFYETLHPPDVIPLPKPKLTFEKILRQGTKKLSKTFNVLLAGSLALARRPYYFALFALLFWAFHLAYFAGAHQAFKKTGPLLYAACAQEITVVDPLSFRVMSRIATAETKAAAFLFAGEKTIWLASPRGMIQGFSAENAQAVAKFSAGQAVGSIAAGRPGILLASFTKDNAIAALAENTGNLLSVTPVGKKPGDIVYEKKTNEIYVLNAAAGTLAILDPTRRADTKNVTFSSPASHILGSPDGNYLYVSFDDQKIIQVFDPVEKTVITSIDLELPGPYAMTASKDRLVVTARGGNAIFLIEAGAWTKKGEVVLDQPEEALLSPDGTTIFATNAAGDLLALDASTGTVRNRVKVGKEPALILYVP